MPIRRTPLRRADGGAPRGMVASFGHLPPLDAQTLSQADAARQRAGITGRRDGPCRAAWMSTRTADRASSRRLEANQDYRPSVVAPLRGHGRGLGASVDLPLILMSGVHRERDRAEGFGELAAMYDQTRPSYPIELVNWLSRNGTGTAVDIGCGTGRVASLLVDAGWSVIGVEPNERMADIARDHGVRVVVAPFEQCVLPGATAPRQATPRPPRYEVEPLRSEPNHAGCIYTRVIVTYNGTEMSTDMPTERPEVNIAEAGYWPAHHEGR